MYFFTVSGIVIDRYFIPSVQCICEDLKITPVNMREMRSIDRSHFILMHRTFQDVGAAIFMATATATPELFTNLISTFVTDSDMGVGTVIGSLMFNILGVTSISVLLLNAVSKTTSIHTRESNRKSLFAFGLRFFCSKYSSFSLFARSTHTTASEDRLVASDQGLFGIRLQRSVPADFRMGRKDFTVRGVDLAASGHFLLRRDVQ